MKNKIKIILFLIIVFSCININYSEATTCTTHDMQYVTCTQPHCGKEFCPACGSHSCGGGHNSSGSCGLAHCGSYCNKCYTTLSAHRSSGKCGGSHNSTGYCSRAHCLSNYCTKCYTLDEHQASDKCGGGHSYSAGYYWISNDNHAKICTKTNPDGTYCTSMTGTSHHVSSAPYSPNDTGHSYLCSTCMGDVPHGSQNMQVVQEDHLGGEATCVRGKICSKCQKEYTSAVGHNYSVWQHDESSHWKKCSRCSITTAAEPHSGGTHDNNGVCTSCTYQYQIHSKSGTLTGTPDATNHYYACSVSGCTFAYSEKHIGQTHANGGKCTTCSKVYVTHAITSTLVGTATETKHYFACVASGCTYQYEVAHVGATHANGGKCTDCGVVYQIHFPTTKITGTSTAANHWLACSFSGCTSAFTRNHEWTWSTTEHKKTCNIAGCGYFVTHTATWKYYNPAQHRCNSESCPLAQNHSWSYVQIAGNLEEHLLKCTCSNQEALLEPHIDADHNNICDKCKMQLWIMTYSPSTLTNQNVVATLNLWNKQTYTHTFVENGSYDIPLTDQDANQKITATVTWIDKSIIGRIEYSTTKPTKGTVTATILSDSESITVTNNGGSNQYTFTENGIFTFEVKDARGNTASFVAKVSWIQKESASISTEYTSLKTGYVFGNITIKMNRKWKLPAGTTNNIDIKVVSENLTTRAQAEVPRSKIKISALNVKNADTGETYGDIESKEFEAGTYDLRFAIGGPNVFIDTKCKYIITLNSFNLLVSGNPTVVDTYDINKIEVYVEDLLDLT